MKSHDEKGSLTIVATVSNGHGEMRSGHKTMSEVRYLNDDECDRILLFQGAE